MFHYWCGNSVVTLTAAPVVAAAAIVALVAIAAVPATWDRWRRRRAAGRTILVLLASIATTLATGLFVNAQAGFFPTVSSLYSQRTPVNVGQNGVRAALSSSTAVDTAALASAHQDGHGVVARIPLDGSRTGLRRTAAIYLPDAYFAPGWEHVRFPVVEMLSGSPGNPSQLLQQLRLGPTLDSLIDQHVMAPTVVVLPDTNGSPVRDLECVDSAHGIRDDTYLSQEVPASVATRFRVQAPGSGWAVFGMSTGGYCAVNLALRHPTQFSVAVSISGYYRPLTDPTTGPLFGSGSALRDANDPSWRVTNLPVPASHLWLSAGTGEPTQLRGLRRFAALQRAPLQITTVVLPGGGHNFSSWRAVLPQALAFVTANLPAPQAQLATASWKQ